MFGDGLATESFEKSDLEEQIYTLRSNINVNGLVSKNRNRTIISRIERDLNTRVTIDDIITIGKKTLTFKKRRNNSMVPQQNFNGMIQGKIGNPSPGHFYVYN